MLRARVVEKTVSYIVKKLPSKAVNKKAVNGEDAVKTR